MFTKIMKVCGVASVMIVALFVAALVLVPDPEENYSQENNTPVPTEQPPEAEVKTEITGPAETPSQQITRTVAEPNEPGSEVIQSLNQIQEMLKSLDKRIVSIEDELDLARLQEAEPQESAEPDNLSNEEYSADSLAALEKRKQYFNTLEQVFAEEIDEQTTTEKQSYFENMIGSQAKWQNDASVQSVSCSQERCKLIVRIDDDMDATARFELDGMIMLSQGDLPSSMVREIKNGDGTEDMVVYFAKSRSAFPARE